MSANVDQRSKGQPSQVSNGTGKDVMKEEDPYIQQAPQHPVRSWSDQASDGAYGAAPMSTAGVSDSFFHNYYAPNMSYPFISQGLGGSEASWSNSADSMFGMGYDYSNVYGGFGFPFNNWEYPSDYWSGSQPPVRKDQRGYAEEPYYAPPEMIPTDSYGMMNGTAPPPEPQEPIGTVEQGLRAMNIAPPTSAAAMDSRKKMVDMSQPPILTDGFGGGDPSLMMPPSMPSNSAPGVMSGGSGGGSQGSSKKTSWAAIASQPARPQQQMRPRTIPRAPVHPNKSMDIGTWDTRGNPAKQPMSMTQPLPSQPPPPRQSWATNSVRSRPIQPHSTSGPGNVTGPSSGSSNSSNSGSTNNNNLNSNPNSTAPNSGSHSNNTSSGNNSSNANNNSSSSVVAPTASNNSGNNMSLGGAGMGGPPPSSSYASYPSNPGSNNMGGSRNVVANSNPTTTNGSHGEAPVSASVLAASNPVLDQLKSSNLYNPKEFNLNPKSARFFVIKSYSEDDIHRSIKYNIWCSTEHGNKRLDQAFREREGKGPVYLIYSVNGSGHFCGIAQMMSPVDYGKSAGVWAQDKWKGQMEVKWVYVKDVPNSQLRHIRLENNENKPVTNSRDTQEVPPEKGKQVLRIMHSYKHLTSIFDDFTHYEKRQEEDQHQTHHHQQSHHQQHSMHRDNRSDHHSGYNNHRDNRGGGDPHDRDNHHRNDHFRNDGRGDGRGDHRGDHRGDNRFDSRGGDYRNDGREHRGGFDRDHRDHRGDGRNNRDNRRGGRPN